MSSLRFKVGELAIISVSLTGKYTGETIEIGAVGPFATGEIVQLPSGRKARIASGPRDYVWEGADGKPLVARDWQLRKIDPPAEPASLTRECECEVVA